MRGSSKDTFQSSSSSCLMSPAARRAIGAVSTPPFFCKTQEENEQDDNNVSELPMSTSGLVQDRTNLSTAGRGAIARREEDEW